MIARRLAIGATLALAALALSDGLLGNPFEHQSARNRFLQDFVNEQYGAAAARLRGPGVAAWEREARLLRQAHGTVRPVQNGDLVGWRGEPPFTSVRVTWSDGYERCFHLRASGGDTLALTDGGWHDCANVPFNSTPPPGP